MRVGGCVCVCVCVKSTCDLACLCIFVFACYKYGYMYIRMCVCLYMYVCSHLCVCMHIAYSITCEFTPLILTLKKFSSMTFLVTFYVHSGIVVGNKIPCLLTVMIILVLFRNLDLRNSLLFPCFHIRCSCGHAKKQADKCT